MEVAKKIVDVLKKNGFTIKWNNSLDNRIEIYEYIYTCISFFFYRTRVENGDFL